MTDVDQDLLTKLEYVPTHPAEEFDAEAALSQIGLAPVPVSITETEEGPLLKIAGDVSIEGDLSVRVGAITAVTGNPKDAIGDTKPDLSLVPQAFNLMVSQAMMDGAKKYGPYNWRDNPVRARVYIAAAMRHLAQYLDGEDIDPTSGVYHVGHAGACLAILGDALTVGNLIDDRPKPGKTGEWSRRFGETKSFKE